MLLTLTSSSYKCGETGLQSIRSGTRTVHARPLRLVSATPLTILPSLSTNTDTAGMNGLPPRVGSTVTSLVSAFDVILRAFIQHVLGTGSSHTVCQMPVAGV